MTNRLVIVTGGARGIGESIVTRLVKDGYHVVVFDVLVPGNPQADVEYFTVDISNRAAVAEAVDEAVSRNGAPHGLVHNAAYQFMSPYAAVSDEQWQRSFAVNVTGAFNLTQEVLPHMQAAQSGRVVFITSSSLYSPARGMAHYIATKGALTGLMRGLSVEYGGDNITVNAIAPGLTRTTEAIANVPAEHFEAIVANQALHRSGIPSDQAGVVSFLLSPDSAFMTGQTLLNDGGEGHL